MAEDFVEHQQGLPQGREGLKDVIRDLRRAFPDLSYEVVQMVADGEKVWGHFRARGTNEGPFMGNSPTGKTMQIDVIDIARYEGESWWNTGAYPTAWGSFCSSGSSRRKVPPRNDATAPKSAPTSENSVMPNFGESTFHALG